MYAKAYRVPLGCYPDVVNFAARCVVAPIQKINVNEWRELNDKLVSVF